MKNSSLDFPTMRNFYFLLIVCGLPLVYLPVFGYMNSAFSKFSVFFVLVLFYFIAFLLGRKSTQHREEKSLAKEDVLLLLYFSWVLLSVIGAEEPIISLLGRPIRMDGVLSLLLHIVVFTMARRYSGSIEKVFLFLLLGSIVISFHALLQFYGWDPIPMEMYRTPRLNSAASAMGNPNFLGSYLVLLLPLALFFSLQKKKKWGTLLYGLLFFTLLATRTRGTWIGGFFAVLIFLYLDGEREGFTKHLWRRYIGVVSTTVLVLGLFMLTTQDLFLQRFLSIFFDMSRFLRGGEDYDMGGSYRIYVWERTLEIIRMHPLFGVGPENLWNVMDYHYEAAIIERFGVYYGFDKAHNEYLHIAVTSGIPALLFYLAFVGRILRKSIRRRRTNSYYLPLLASILGYSVQAFFNIQVVMVYYIFMAFLGLLLLLERRSLPLEKSAEEIL